MVIKTPLSAFITEEELEEELNAFLEHCHDHHLTDEEIERVCAQDEAPPESEEPSDVPSASTKIHLARYGLYLCVVFGVLYVASYNETVSWYMSAIGRIALVKILPIFDWTKLKNERCLLENNFEAYQEINYNCAVCESLTEIEELSGEYDPEDLFQRYLKRDVPLVLKNITWKINEDLPRSLLENPLLSQSQPCKLSTNLNIGATLSDFLPQIDGHQSYFFHFQNCEFAAVKAFRGVAPRPDFLSPTISPVQYSWLLMSKDYRVKKFKPVELREKFTVVGQRSGSNEFKLVPQGECTADCEVLTVALMEGEALMFSSLWDLEYRPKGDGVNVAVVLEAH